MVDFGTFYFGTFDLEKFRISFQKFLFESFENQILSLHFDYQSRTGHVIFQNGFLPSKYGTSNRQKCGPDRNRFEPGWTRTGAKIEFWANSNKNLKSEQIGVIGPWIFESN